VSSGQPGRAIVSPLLRCSALLFLVSSCRCWLIVMVHRHVAP